MVFNIFNCLCSNILATTYAVNEECLERLKQLRFINAE